MEKAPVGILGLNSRSVAESAKKCGFRVYLADYFYDSDVIADHHFFLQGNPLRPNLSREYSAEKLAEFAIEKLNGIVDNLILTSGIGCNFRSVKKLEKHFEILGNSSGKIRKSKDWKNIKKILDDVGVSYPETIIAKSSAYVESAVNKLGYPVVVKSMIKSTGILPRLIRNETEMEKSLSIIRKKNSEILVQKYIKGIPISVSLLSDGENALSLSINRQLIGIKEFGASREFTYCGHIVPFDIIGKRQITKSSEEIISNLKLLGSNGIDYVLSEKKEIFFMEINPRFQDTISSVEKFCRINLFERHLKAIEGIIEHPTEYSNMHYGKGIIFAGRKTTVTGLENPGGIGNIPLNGTSIRKGEPVCSVFAEGRSNADVMSKLSKRVNGIRSSNLL